MCLAIERSTCKFTCWSSEAALGLSFLAMLSGCAPVCYIFGRLRSLESRRIVYSLHLAAEYVRFCPWPPRRPAPRRLLGRCRCSRMWLSRAALDPERSCRYSFDHLVGAAKKRQRKIVKGSWLNQLEHAIVGHGISLLRWGSAGFRHPHDMPPFQFAPSPTFSEARVRTPKIKDADRHANANNNAGCADPELIWDF